VGRSDGVTGVREVIKLLLLASAGGGVFETTWQVKAGKTKFCSPRKKTKIWGVFFFGGSE